MINNTVEIVKLIQTGRWEEAKEAAKDSLGASQAINGLKSLLKNGDITQEELERLKSMKASMSNLLSSGWISEYDSDYFSLLFAYIDLIEKGAK
ncbi:MAG: hypothetical protein ABSB40_03330 [Nitrososphaeria archaeon]